MFWWFTLPKVDIATKGIYLFGIELTWGGTIHFEKLEFIADHIDNQSLSPEGNDSCTIFVGMVHSGSPSLHAILEELAREDDLISSDRESSNFPIPWDCNVVTPVIPVVTTTTGNNETSVG
jgi:hypothetical protein